LSTTPLGPISTTNKIQCGDVILLKGGSTQTSAQGGAWRIDGQIAPPYYSYYTSTCTTSARIVVVIATSDQWPGSTGNFTIDGTGVMPACIQNQFCGAYGYVGLVNVFRVNYFILKGLSATQRIEIKNAARGPSQELGMGLLVSNAFDMLHNMLRGDGFKGKWLSVHDNTGAGIAVSTWKNWIVIQTVSYNNGGPGYSAGAQSDLRVRNGAFVDAEAYNNGTAAYNGFADAFFFDGANQLWCVRCSAHDNVQRGFNTGTISNTMGSTYMLRDMRAYNNGTCDPNQSWCQNVSRNGFGFSGSDLLNQYPQQNFIVRAIPYPNPPLPRS